MVLLAYVQVVRDVNMKKAAKGLSVTIQNLRKAAEQGDAEAQFSLGSCYDEGEGVRVDKSLAVKWYRMAAERGDADAQYNLAACYDNGEGVRKNSVAAVKWCRKAAEQGLAVAKEGLRLMCKPA